MTLEHRWRERAESLTLRDIYTENWRDFRTAIGCRNAKDFESVQQWIEETEESLIAAFDHFEELGFFSEAEGCDSEVALSQRFLVEGVELWLEALRLLREDEDEKKIVDLARQGQKLLVTVQLMEGELALELPQIAIWGS